MTRSDAAEPTITAYGLALPTVTDVHDALRRVYAADAGDELFHQLMREAGVSAGDRSRPALERLLAAMAATADPVTRLCAESTAIRLATYDRLSLALSAIGRTS